VAGAAVVIAAVVIVAIPSSSPKLAYTELPAGCSLVSAATLARYAPDTTGSPFRRTLSSTDHLAGCIWLTGGSSGDLMSVAVTAEVFGSSQWLSAAQGRYDAEAHARDRKITITAQAVSGLGDQATNMFLTPPSGSAAGTGRWTVPEAVLLVRSGNAVIAVDYIVTAGQNAPPKPSDAALEAAATAVARDVLAVLSGSTRAEPAAAASAAQSPPGSRYAGPGDACTLVKASTFARYAPGAAIEPGSSPPPLPGQSSCYWVTPSDNDLLSAIVTVYATAGDAQQGFLASLQGDRKNGLGTTRSVQQVKGLPVQQATALFQTGTGLQAGPGDSPIVELLLWAGNAVIETTFTELSTSGSSLSSATMLAADVAMARDVLAGLPR
jgi:hypothetical protein